MAAKTWFGKPAKDLTGTEGAVLPGLLRSPSAYEPGATRRHVPDGADRLERGRRPERPARLRRRLVEAELAREGSREGRLQAGGLTVRTTLRGDAQAAAVGAVQAVAPEPETEDQSAVQGALVAVRPGTGEVLAYYGGRTGDGGFDYASQGRQDAGSTMKAHVLVAALEQGISLGTTLDGDSARTLPGHAEPVGNVGEVDHGEVDLVEATAKSVNTAYVDLAGRLGPQAVAGLAHRVGSRSSDRLGEPEGPPSLGIALGVYGVRVVDQASAFATFASGGVLSAPRSVLSRTAPRGAVVYRVERVTERVLPADVTSDVTAALQQVVARGTASARGRLDGGRPAIGKTARRRAAATRGWSAPRRRCRQPSGSAAATTSR